MNRGRTKLEARRLGGSVDQRDAGLAGKVTRGGAECRRGHVGKVTRGHGEMQRNR